MTQARRHGIPIGRIKCEADLHPVRQAFTDLALRVRAKTGALLQYALSFTVTSKTSGKNLSSYMVNQFLWSGDLSFFVKFTRDDCAGQLRHDREGEIIASAAFVAHLVAVTTRGKGRAVRQVSKGAADWLRRGVGDNNKNGARC